MSDLAPLQWLRVRNEPDLAKIKKFIKGRGVNTYSPRVDKNGNNIMLFGWDDKPDSDWGKFRGHSRAIWFETAALADAGEDLARLAMGWPARTREEAAQ